MKNYTFHFEIKDVIKQFAAAFDDIVIKRYNKDRQSGDTIAVNYVYAPKSRTLHDLVNKSQTLKLPCVSISMGGVRRNQNRVFNKIAGSEWRIGTGEDKWINLLQPVPVDITVNVSIITRFQDDMDQIITNFVPYTDPYFVISWKWPLEDANQDIEIRSKVMWSESINYQYPTELSPDAAYWLVADTSFTIESWLFKNQSQNSKAIYEIDANFYNVLTDLNDICNTEVVQVSARPQFTNISPAFILKDTQIPVDIFGYMCQSTDSIYISASNNEMLSSAPSGQYIGNVSSIDLFGSTSLSASYPAFSGIQLDPSKITTYSDNYMSLVLYAKDAGNLDIISTNEAGYGTMSVDLSSRLSKYEYMTDGEIFVEVR